MIAHMRCELLYHTTRTVSYPCFLHVSACILHVFCRHIARSKKHSLVSYSNIADETRSKPVNKNSLLQNGKEAKNQRLPVSNMPQYAWT